MGPGLNQRVGVLETKVAEIATILGAFRGTLEEIKQSMSEAARLQASQRPAWWMILPSVFAFVTMLVGGLLFFTGIKAEIAAMQMADDKTNTRIERIIAIQDRQDARQWEGVLRELEASRERARP